MEIQINNKNIKKHLNSDIDIGGGCGGGDVGTIRVTEFVLYFSLSKQYPDKHRSSPLTNTQLRDAGRTCFTSHQSHLKFACSSAVQKLIQLRKGGDHLAVYNYIIHLVSFITRSGGDQRVKSDKKSLDWGLDDINCLSFILI